MILAEIRHTTHPGYNPKLHRKPRVVVVNKDTNASIDTDNNQCIQEGNQDGQSLLGSSSEDQEKKRRKCI